METNGLRRIRSNIAAATFGAVAGGRRSRGDGEDAVHVAVHQEEVGIRAREHDDAHRVVGVEVVEDPGERRR